MRRVLRGVVLIAAAMLAACAGSESRESTPDPLETPQRMRADRGPVSGGGVAPSGSNASVSFEYGSPEAATSARGRTPEPPDWNWDAARGSAFDAGILYAMAYFPSPSGVETERANSLAELYADARPGYALYTFLIGGPVEVRTPADLAAYRELLRVIETYVVSADAGAPGAAAAGPDASGRHGFLVQVNALRPDSDLLERVQPGISLQMQTVLARQLRIYGHLALADRLEQSTGPFLVTSLRPTMIPTDERVPLLVVDLHDLGPEYIYSLVDAYDRPIPGDLIGRPESLAVIGRRLQQIFPSRRVDSGAAPPPTGGWIWLIGVPGQTRGSEPTADAREDEASVADVAMFSNTAVAADSEAI